MKDWFEENRERLSDLALWIGTTAIVVLFIFVAVALSRDGIIAETRCKSLQGEYGGGKCFKDGKEV